MKTILAIAVGGAIGAVLRFLFNNGTLKLLGDSFPYGTLGVNILGSLMMGILIAAFASFWQPAQEFRAFFLTGLLGAFTTFSSFSLDVSVLYERGEMLSLAIYILASITLSITALFAGIYIVKAIAA